MTSLKIEPYVLPGAALEGENPLPFFRSRKQNQDITVSDSMPEEKRAYLGWQTGERLLPYRMQDRYSRQRKTMSLKSIVLENDFLKAVFIPDLGGRLVSLIHKGQNRDLLFRNPVFQPANLAIRNAWFSGGIEWNVGQYGHTFFTCSPIFAAKIYGLDGEPGLRLYEYERCKNLFWQVDFFLPEKSPYLLAYVKVINSHQAESSMYWWTNIAVPESSDVRVLAPTSKVIYADPDVKGFSYGDLPYLHSFEGKDATYSLNSQFANEFFFQCQQVNLPWMAALDKGGKGLFEASTQPLNVRKMFCWGYHQGGRHWQDFLAEPGQAYIEIQAGLAPTQCHGLPMPAKGCYSWLEAFGLMEADPVKVHGYPYESACAEVDQKVKEKLPQAELETLAASYSTHSNHLPSEVLHYGSGWGALEIQRAKANGEYDERLNSFLFPVDSVGPEQKRWSSLLSHGKLDDQDPALLPGEWMVQPDWQKLLEKSLAVDSNRNWYALLHYGVMLMENFDEKGAAEVWQESLSKKPSAWAYRNLAYLARTAEKTEEVLHYYDLAWETLTSGGNMEASLAQEYLGVLVEVKQYRKAWEVYQSLTPEMAQLDRTQILCGRIALELGYLDVVEKVLSKEYAVIREGEIELTDLWFEMWAKRVSSATGKPIDAALRQQVETDYPPPIRIDFRLKN